MKNKSKKPAVVLSEFHGVDVRLPVGSNAAESVNYRIMPDGSLKKRNGFKKLLTLPDTPSCIASINRDGERKLLTVAGDRIYSLDIASKSYTALPGKLTASSGESALVSLREKLFVFDGYTLGEVSDTGIAPPTGYAPLYGKGWHPTKGGDIYEPLNILSRNFRISFIGTSGDATLYLPKTVESVTRVEINGIHFTSSGLIFNATNCTLSSNNLARDGIEIVVWCTSKEDNADLPKLNSCRQACSVGSGSDAVIFCGRSSGAEHLLFRSVPVSHEALDSSRRGFPESSDVYFPSGFSVGSNDLPIRAVLPLDDRVIVYNDDEAWLVPSIDRGSEPTLLCAGVGCTSDGAAVICGELPVSLCGNSVYRWEPDLEAYNELIAVCISSPIAPLIDDELAVRGKLITDRETRELWLYDPASPTRPVLLYDRDHKQWYRFDGFSPKLAFYHGGRIGFTSGADVFLFSPDAVSDCLDGVNDTPITAEFVGGWLDLDDFADQKSAARVAVKYEGQLTLTLEYDNGASEVLSLGGTSPNSAPSVDHIRLRRERFRQVRFSFESTGLASGRVYGISLYADTDEGVCET